jgi:hypothetical protein
MEDDLRRKGPDRRARPRGGRREGDARKPWYMRQTIWLTTASLLFVGWRRLRNRTGG